MTNVVNWFGNAYFDGRNLKEKGALCLIGNIKE